MLEPTIFTAIHSVVELRANSAYTRELFDKIMAAGAMSNQSFEDLSREIQRSSLAKFTHAHGQYAAWVLEQKFSGGKDNEAISKLVSRQKSIHDFLGGLSVPTPTCEDHVGRSLLPSTQPPDDEASVLSGTKEASKGFEGAPTAVSFHKQAHRGKNVVMMMRSNRRLINMGSTSQLKLKPMFSQGTFQDFGGDRLALCCPSIVVSYSHHHAWCMTCLTWTSYDVYDKSRASY